MKKIIILLSLMLCNFGLAQIVEIKNISEAKNLDGYQLIIFDLDNTIMETAQALGSDQWFYHTLKNHEKEGLDYKQALEKTLLKFYEIQSVTQVKPVEKEIKNLIEDLQDKNIAILGLTVRNSYLFFAAIKQMDSLNIDLSKTAPHNDTIFFENGMIYKKGILFADGKNKDLALKTFFKKVNFFPKSVVFVDDKLKNVLEIDNFCKLNKIKFLGYRYGFLDEKVQNYNSEIADIQHKYFINILSDEEALSYIKNSEK